MQDFSSMYHRWLEQEDLDEELKAELLLLKKENEIYDSFYRNLEFGTGGLRGILGAGTNRMNIYTVRKATQGLADYINKYYGKSGTKYNGRNPAVSIAYDSRLNSKLFACEAAWVLAANDIKTYIYSEIMPTPALSFAVRYYKCSAGIMVTASHNPSSYNGYKVYNEEGCQMTLDAANEVLDFIEKVDIFNDVKTLAKDKSEIERIPLEAYEAYLSAVYKERMGQTCENLSVVYTPLNGTGNKPVRKILEMIGVTGVNIVTEQESPDGNFPTCPFPNPEKKEALTLGLKLCKKLSSEGKAPDLLLATDPDCDRVGIAVRHSDQTTGIEDYHLISGNEVGVLLLDFICKKRLEINSELGTEAQYINSMPPNPIAIKTIVSSKMADRIANDYGVKIIDVLTGFKFIGEQIGLLEEQGEESRFIFGFEESYGYLAGSYVRDKDAVNASMLICEMTAFYKQNAKTLVNRLEELYQQYGYYKNELLDITFEGSAGMEKMNDIMKGLRAEPPKYMNGKKVLEIADYQSSQRRILGCVGACVLVAGSKPIRLPKSEVLEYVLEDGSSIIIRPSGTEPKLKIYLSAKGENKQEAENIIKDIKVELSKMI